MTEKAQTSMILIVLLLVVFAALAVFLLSMARTVSHEEYMDLYVNNLLLSIMRTDTGYGTSDCKLMSDVLACAFATPSHLCGGMSCLDFANGSLTEYTETFGEIAASYSYLFEAETYGCWSVTGEECTVLMFGDESLKGYRSKRTSNPYVIQKSMGGNQYNLKVKLYLARKRP
jgi:hypothetical protein